MKFTYGKKELQEILLHKAQKEPWIHVLSEESFIKDPWKKGRANCQGPGDVAMCNELGCSYNDQSPIDVDVFNVENKSVFHFKKQLKWDGAFSFASHGNKCLTDVRNTSLEKLLRIYSDELKIVLTQDRENEAVHMGDIEKAHLEQQNIVVSSELNQFSFGDLYNEIQVVYKNKLIPSNCINPICEWVSIQLGNGLVLMSPASKIDDLVEWCGNITRNVAKFRLKKVWRETIEFVFSAHKLFIENNLCD